LRGKERGTEGERSEVNIVREERRESKREEWIGGEEVLEVKG
jgi:hypothetical protein